MKSAIITIGCSASGKSTWANSMVTQGYSIIERDNFRQAILMQKVQQFDFYKDNMWKYWNFKWEKEVDDMVDEKIKSGKDKIIISDTNLNVGRREALEKKLESLGYEVTFEVFGEDMGIEELWNRDRFRQHCVGFQTIAKQYQEFRKQFPRWVVHKDVDEQLDKCVLCDIDGTIAIMNSRSAYEWDKVDQDEPNDVVVSSIRGLYRDGYKIIFMSGRDSVCRQKNNKLD